MGLRGGQRRTNVVLQWVTTGVNMARVLVLGGTKFLGRAITGAALAAGHEVTLFNRGITNPDLFPGAEHLRGDRTSDLSALEGRELGRGDRRRCLPARGRPVLG